MKKVTLDDCVTIVSGLPRSGTSLMMQMLRAGGLPLLSDNRRAADENNPRGYFEFEPVKRLRLDQTWLVGAQGRAVKIIHLLVRELPTDGRFHYRLLLMKRPLAEILASQRVMLERAGEPSADHAVLTKIYQSQLLQLEQWLARQPAFSYRLVDYHRLLTNALNVAEEVNTFLGGGLNVAAMAGAVDPTLCHQHSTDDSVKD
jgi:hypothetical protein